MQAATGCDGEVAGVHELGAAWISGTRCWAPIGDMRALQPGTDDETVWFFAPFAVFMPCKTTRLRNFFRRVSRFARSIPSCSIHGSVANSFQPLTRSAQGESRSVFTRKRGFTAVPPTPWLCCGRCRHCPSGPLVLCVPVVLYLPNLNDWNSKLCATRSLCCLLLAMIARLQQ